MEHLSGIFSSFNISKVARERISIRLTVFTTCLFIIVSSRTARYFISRFWNGLGNFFQLCWEKILECVGDDPVTLWVYGPIAVMLLFYWGGGICYLLMDVTNKPTILRKYKIRPGSNEPVERVKLLKAIFWVVFNQTVVAYPFGYLTLWVMERRGYPSFKQLPALQAIICDILIFALISEVIFYYSHRLLHIQPFYKYIHKKHHEWQNPISIAAFYCHPVEHVIANLSNLHLGFMVMGSHIITVYIYYIMGIIDALNNHCGYHFPFTKSPEFHDFHHARFNENFGLLGILDRLHGTDKKFRESVEFRRHSIMLHLIPPRDLIPN